MATTNADQAYPLVGSFPEPQRSLVRILLDRIHALEGRSDDTAPRRTALDLGGFAATSLAAPTQDTDAATKAYVDQQTDAATIRQTIEVGGTSPLDVTNLLGVLAQPQKMGVRVIPDSQSLPDPVISQAYEVISWNGKLYFFDPSVNPGVWTLLSTAPNILADTHANRLLNYLPASQPTGLLFWETDRTALFRNVLITTVPLVKRWTLMLSRPLRSGTRPADLGIGDTGFIYDDTTGAYQFWSGAAWFYFTGVKRGTHGARPAAANAQTGFYYMESDRGDQVYRWDIVTPSYILVPGWGGPMNGTIDAVDQKPVGLGVDDTGFLFNATDYDRVFLWNGAAWVDAPAQPTRNSIVLFATAPAGAGWHLCDGATVNQSTAAGAVAAVVLPDLVTNVPFLRTGTSVTTGTFAATGSFYNYARLLPYVRL